MNKPREAGRAGLEQFSWWCSEAIAGVAEVVGALGGGEDREGMADVVMEALAEKYELEVVAYEP